MSLTDTIERIEARYTERRRRSGDRAANLAMQPRRIARPDGETAPRAKCSPIPRKGAIPRGRPLKVVERLTPA